MSDHRLNNFIVVSYNKQNICHHNPSVIPFFIVPISEPQFQMNFRVHPGSFCFQQKTPGLTQNYLAEVK